MTLNETYEEFRERFDGAIITTYVFAMIVVPLKIWCRKRAGGWSNMGFDEVFTVLGAAFVTGTFAVIYSAVRPLLGKMYVDVAQSPEDLAKLPAFALNIWVANLLYTVSVMFMKLSIVALYWRLFGLTTRGRIPLLFVAGLVVAWGITIACIVVFNCEPIAGSWDLTITTAKCIDKKSFYVGGSVPNVITDLILVILPLPYVWRLHASLAQRIVLGGIFALGMFVSIVSMIRLSVLLDTTGGEFDITYTFKDVYLWSLVEINVGLSCACLPSLRPLVRVIGLKRLFSSGRSRPTDMRTPEPSSGLPGNRSSRILSSKRKQNNMFSHLEDDDEFEMISDQKMKGPWVEGTSSRVSHDTDRNSNGSTESSRKHVGLGAITVQRDFEVSSTLP